MRNSSVIHFHGHWDRAFRKILSQFRLSSHTLKIEVGRHCKPRKLPLEERTCSLCTLNVIEDEKHLLLHCPFYEEERSHLFCKILTHDKDLLDETDFNNVFSNIMSSENSMVLFSLCKFLYKCFKRRNAVMS